MTSSVVNKISSIIIRTIHSPKPNNMPKKVKKEAKTTPPKEASSSASSKQDVFQEKTDHVLVQVLAKAGAKRTEIVDISTDGVGIAVQAPPVDGKANEEIVNLLAEILGIRKNVISIERGQKNRHKIIRVSTEKITLEDIKAKLQAELDA